MSNPIDDLTNKFHFFEEKISISDWELWDGIRFNTYYAIIDKINRKEHCADEKSSVFGKIKTLYKCLMGLKLFKELISPKKILFISASRFKDDNGKWYDPNIIDILEMYKKESIILDNWTKAHKYAYSAYKNTLILLWRKFVCRKRYYKEFSQKISLNISDYFGIYIEEKSIYSFVRNYIAERDFYRFILKILRPKLILIMQSGPQQAIFRVAKDYKIPTIELQHGNVYYSHMSYSYPTRIKRDFSTPTLFFAFSEFWKKKIIDVYPVDNIIVTGNTAASCLPQLDKKYDLTFITNMFYTNQFIKIIVELRLLGYNGAICLKLHPHQIAEAEQIRNTLKDRSLFNIDLVVVEKNIKEIIAQSERMVMIHSTAIYEAVDAGVPVFLYEEGLFAGLEDVMENQLVSVFSNSKDLFTLIENHLENHSENTNRERYFEPFRPEIARKIINQYVPILIEHEQA